MKQTTVYKIVYPCGGKFFSGFTGWYYSYLLIGKILPSHILEYVIGEVVTPKFGKLFAFSSLEAARKYAGTRSFRIFEAVASGRVIKAKRKRVVFADSGEQNMKKIWSKKSLRGMTCRTQEIPEGTVLCENLTLVKMV